MFISFFTGKVMLFYGISLIMKEKSNASALSQSFIRVFSKIMGTSPTKYRNEATS